MKDYEVRDLSLAPSGHQKIEWGRGIQPDQTFYRGESYLIGTP